MNYLSSNRATLFLGKDANKTSLSCTDFTLPDISIPTIEVPTRFNNGKEAGTKVEFSELEVTFIVDENLENWLEMYNWVVALGIPKNHEQYQEYRRITDGSLQIYTSHNNHMASFKFYELKPTYLSGIQFSEADSETVVKKASTRFNFLMYEYEQPQKLID